MSQSYIHFRHIRIRAQKRIEDCKVDEGLIAQKFELNRDFTLANYQIYQTSVFMLHPATLTQTTSIMESS